jgi:PAS domain S-box-containing protein
MPAHHPAEFLRALLDASPSAIIACDPEGHVRLWSRGAERLLGWTEDQAIGHSLPLESELQEQSEGEGGFQTQRKDGTLIDVEVRRVSWRDAQGTSQGTLFILADATRRLTIDRKSVV